MLNKRGPYNKENSGYKKKKENKSNKIKIIKSSREEEFIRQQKMQRTDKRTNNN